MSFKVIRTCLLFCFTTLCDWLKNSRHFLDQSKEIPNPIYDLLAHIFPRLAYVTYTKASSSNWFVVVSVC